MLQYYIGGDILKKKRSKPNLIVGLLILLLAFVGVVSLVITAGNRISKSIEEKNAEKAPVE